MAEPAMCRVCLAEDVRMCRITGTHLQEVYESLATVTLGMDDRTPILACYICRAQLENCFRLRRRCRRSQELYQRMLHDETWSAGNRRERSASPGLAVVAVVCLDVGGVGSSARTDGAVKEEGGDAPHVPEGARPPHESSPSAAAGEGGGVKREPPDADAGVSAPPGDPLACPPGLPTGGPVRVKVEEPLGPEQRLAALLRNIAAPDRACYFTCRQCKRSFYERARLNAHRCAHGERRPYACELCPRRYKLRSRLAFHLRQHVQREPYQCDVCDKSFLKKYQLNYHVRSHTGEKPYQCNVCEKRFITKSYLLKHVAMHSADRPHRCTVCGKSFKGKSNLVVHTRQHSGEKPYQCSVCKKRFNYNGNLKKHLQIHSGERPHGCDVCDKSFINNSDLVKHRRTHTSTGEKPYQCDVCKETFNYNSNFLKHKRVSCKTGPID